jgi:hypothetical protein
VNANRIGGKLSEKKIRGRLQQLRGKSGELIGVSKPANMLCLEKLEGQLGVVKFNVNIVETHV